MNIIKENDKNFNVLWKQFIDKYNLNFHYSLDRMEYLKSNGLKNESFLVEKNSEIIGLVVLLITENYLPIPIYLNSKVEKFIFENIDEIAIKYSLKKIRFFTNIENNNLLKFNYINSNSTTCIVNLSIQKEKLWTNLRRRYKSMINKILKDDNFEFFIMNKDNADYEIHEKYRLLHHKCSGKVTRDKKSFDNQFDILKRGDATIISLLYKNKFIGMLYFYHYNDEVIYASGADEPEYTKKGFNIYHPILWKAQLYFQEKGFKKLDYSQPCGYSEIQGFDDYYDKKQLNISYFKRGMGANVKTLYRYMKYFDKSLFLEDIKRMKDAI